MSDSLKVILMNARSDRSHHFGSSPYIDYKLSAYKV